MTNELEPIVRVIDNRSQAKPGRLVVAIDRKTGKSVADTGLLGFARSLLNDIILFELTVDETHLIENARAAIAVFLTNERSELTFRMSVRAPRKDAVAIVEALFDPELSPAQMLFKRVRNHLGRLLEQAQEQGPESVIERIAANRAQWQAEIERGIEECLHLKADIIFELQLPVIDTDVTVRCDAIQVSPKDAPHAKFPITVSVTLERLSARTSNPLPRSDNERQRLVADVVAKTFRDRIALYTYWFQPEDCMSELGLALTNVLMRYAYGLKSLTIDPVDPPVTAEEQIVDDVSWSGRLARPIPFHIESRVKMSLSGAGIFHARNQPNRKDFIKNEVDAALKAAMHGRDFIDLTAEAEREVHNTVHRRLNERAKTIGHEVDTFVASAAIPEKLWLEPVTIEIEKREYKTKNDLVPAEFEIGLVVQMATLARLEQLIQAHRRTRPNDTEGGANIEIRTAIEESAIRAASRFMAQIEPNSYFSHYERWEILGEDKDAPGQPNYVRSQLVRAIQAELRADFHISRCEVNPRRVDSRVAGVNKLIQQVGDIRVTVDVEPLNSSGIHEAAKISLAYYISGVHPDEWANVIQRGDTPLPVERLARDVKDWSREALAERPLEELYGLASRRASSVTVRKEVEEFVANRVIRYYGAMVGIKSIDWEHNEADQLERDLRRVPIQQERAQLERYRTRLEEYKRESDDESRRSYLRNRRTTLQNLIVANPRESSEDIERLQQYEEELAKVELQLVAANRTVGSNTFRRLALPTENTETGSEDSRGNGPATDEPSHDVGKPAVAGDEGL